MSGPPTQRRRSMAGAQFLGAGFTFLAELGCISGIGWWLDGQFGSAPWILVFGSAVGMIVALSHLLHSASAYEARMKELKQVDASEDRGSD